MDTTDTEEDELYLRRLSGGLFTLQLVDHIILEVCASGTSSVKQRVQRVLSLRGGSLKTIRHVMRGLYHVFYQFYFMLHGSIFLLFY